RFGGAFEANKVFTGIFAIPLAVPLVFGMLMRKPDSKGALLVVFGGAALALTLNIQGWLDWEVSTLIVLLACAGGFVLSGFVGSSRHDRSARFFEQLATPLPPTAIPQIDPGFLAALKRLFRLSLIVSGSFFALVSVFALGDLSGQLALAAGLLCITLGLACRVRYTSGESR
ncbi:MAG: sodium transporter, partial [Planctomycetes bacterium]|nr:sodium transporter [Planctomycetota bacterium]